MEGLAFYRCGPAFLYPGQYSAVSARQAEANLFVIYYAQNDHDPSKLIAETPCKLLRFSVTDGSHIDADLPYAEVEVMKMCMPLLSPASGVIHFKMSEGQAMQVNHAMKEF